MIVYKRHTIVAGGSKSESGESFIPVAYIASEIASPVRHSHALILPEELYRTFEQASEAAFEQAKMWVDEHEDELNAAGELVFQRHLATARSTFPN